MSEAVPLKDQLAEVVRENAMRRTAYPDLVSKGVLSQEQADKSLRATEATERLLALCVEFERELRVFLASAIEIRNLNDPRATELFAACPGAVTIRDLSDEEEE